MLPDNWHMVEFNREKLDRFKEELAKHTKEQEVFEFEGHEYLVNYARYLVLYLEGALADA